MNFLNSYVNLGEVFYEKIQPTPVRSPKLLLWNSCLAKQLMIPDELEQDPAALAQIFSGNRILPGSEPIALAYAGHQFGHFVPQLGDGRAHLLGEVFDESGKKFDIQLKGSGPTRFARGGDGRCAVGPAVREFIMSEAMNAMGIPTSRCLAVVTTGESVFRDTGLPGAIVTRIASSHIRIGTFQFFAARNDHESLKVLSDFTIERHFPGLKEEGENKYIVLLDKVIEKQIQLVTQWMKVGFIHGVMNTDNTSLSGETIDYGPCAMMGNYDPQTVYSSIDTMRRYAFGNQPKIAHWNITRLAECLLPLINTDTNKAIEQVEPLIAEFPDQFNEAYIEMMGKKLGLTSFQQEDQKILFSVLSRLKERNMDYTISFDMLTKSLMSETSASQAKSEFEGCYDLWQKRLSEEHVNSQEIHDLMRQYNPVVIPRNHHVEAVIQECQQNSKVTLAENFLKVLRSPYEELAATSQFQDQPSDGDKDYQTFCGT